MTKEFYETFWNELKEIFVNSVREAKEIGHLSTSQRQAIIRLIEKLETNFLAECKFKNNIKSSFREIERSSTRFNLFITNGLC